MIPHINVSAKFSITVTEDYYSQLSSFMAIRELMNVMRVAVNIIAKGLLVEQQEG
jgi:hypothetical protein